MQSFVVLRVQAHIKQNPASCSSIPTFVVKPDRTGADHFFIPLFLPLLYRIDQHIIRHIIRYIETVAHSPKNHS